MRPRTVSSASPHVRRPWLFYTVVYGLLLFLAVAAVHELIPGLCVSTEGNGNDCPFCELIYASVLVVAVLSCLLHTDLVRLKAPPKRCLAPPSCRFLAYALRAPPTAAHRAQLALSAQQ